MHNKQEELPLKRLSEDEMSASSPMFRLWIWKITETDDDKTSHWRTSHGDKREKLGS